nr:NAD(+) synthase [Lachnospiraceae bacterium]
IYASAGEGESTQDVVYSGHNMIAENGIMLNESALYRPGYIVSEIDVQTIEAKRRNMTTYNVPDMQSKYIHQSFNLEMSDTEITRFVDKAPFVPSNQSILRRRCEEILDIQSVGLKKRLAHTHCKTAVVGISGGLDSTLALLVTTRAFDMLGLDRSGIIAVTMPGFGTTDRTYNNAIDMIDRLGASLREVSIKDAVLQHFTDIGQDPEVHDVTYENGQARERTQILMDIANKENGMVIGTGDMSELALGWATYNGDHMSMYGVNCSVPKTLVRYLVSYYANFQADERLREVLLDVLDTPVSPELLPPKDGKIAQKTEDLVGPYELHDFFLYHMMRYGSNPSKIYRLALIAFENDYDRETILKWLKTFYRRFFNQQFKRSCLPDGPKVGTVSLSPRGDLRMPSDAVADIWLKQIDTLR